VLDLLAEVVEALHRLLEVDLARGAIEPGAQLLDRALDRLLAVLDAAVDLLADVRRQALLGLTQVSLASFHSSVQESRT
jgi:hypothetical protein